MKLTKIIAIVCFWTLLASACSSSSQEENEMGSLHLDVKQSSNTIVIEGVKTNVSVDDYSVRIEDENGNEVQSFAHFSEIPSEIQLNAGNYTVIAESMELQAAAFDAPYMMASQNVSIHSGQTETISLNCRMENVKVSVSFSEDVQNNYDSYSAEITNGEGTLLFDMNENRAGYFSAVAPLSLTVRLSKDGNELVWEQDIPVSANEHHLVNISSSGEVQGQAGSVVNIQTNSGL